MVYDILIQRIISGRYKLGERLSTKKLVTEFKISRSPIKDALNKLYGAGLIEITSRHGHYIRTISRQEVSDYLEFRILLETYAAKKALKYLQDNYRLLEQNLSECISIAESEDAVNLVKFFELDRKFHQMIIGAAQNEIIMKAYSNTNIGLLTAGIQFTNARKRGKTVCKEHKEILEAIFEGDEENIELSLKKHIKNVHEALLDSFTKDPI